MTDALRVALSVVKGLAAQGGILRYAQNDRHLLGMTDALRVALSVVKGLAAQGGILRYARNDRHLLGMGGRPRGGLERGEGSYWPRWDSSLRSE